MTVTTLGWVLATSSLLASSPASLSVYTLENGLTVVLDPVPGAPLTSVCVSYPIGSALHPQSAPHLAHVAEHVAFHPSQHSQGQSFGYSTWVSGVIHSNGYTTPQVTRFCESVAVGGLERLLWAEADRMGWPAGFSRPKALVKARTIVEREENERIDGAYGRLFQAHYERILSGGDDTTKPIYAITRDGLDAFFSRWYRPDRGVLVLSGVIPSQAKEWIEDQFGSLSNPEQAAGDPQAGNATNGSLREEVDTLVSRGAIIAGVTVPPSSCDPAWRILPYYIETMTDGLWALSGGRHLSVGFHRGRKVGWFYLGLFGASKDTAETLEVLLGETLKRVLVDHVDPKAFGTAVAQSASSQRLGMITSHSRAFSLSGWVAQGKRAEDLLAMPKTLSNVTFEEFSSCAAKMVGEYPMHLTISRGPL